MISMIFKYYLQGLVIKMRFETINFRDICKKRIIFYIEFYLLSHP